MGANLFTLAAEPLPSPAPAAIPREVSRAARVLAGERKKQRAIRQVEDAASPDFLAAAEGIVRALAASGAEFTTDAVWDALPADCRTHEPRALGAVFNRLAKANVIRKVNCLPVPSVRPECHRCPKTVWRGAGQ
jgi:hypothetical protein